MAVILLRTVLMYGVILLAVRLMGKRQVSQLQNSELVVTLLLSELAVLPIPGGGEAPVGGPGAHGRPGGLRAAGVRADAEKRAVPAAGVRQPHGGDRAGASAPESHAPPAADH